MKAAVLTEIVLLFRASIENLLMEYLSRIFIRARIWGHFQFV